MTSLIVVDLTPKDAEKLARYSTAAAQTLIPFNGEFLVKGPIESLHGESVFSMKVIIQFPTKQNALDWYNSPDYQAIIPLRSEGMDSQFHLVG